MTGMTAREAFKFRLFVAGNTPNSTQALGNLTAFCREKLLNRHQIELVDVFLEPAQALAEGIFMTPTLLKLAPGPATRIVGSLSNAGVLAQALGLDVALA